MRPAISLLQAVFLLPLAGCDAQFWSRYGVINEMSCTQLMSACSSDPSSCLSALPEACGSVMRLSTDAVDFRMKKDVDILFVIDNSPSMSPKQSALAKNIPKFIQRIDGTGTNYHIGFATSDVGSNVAPGVPWAGNLGQCDTYEGDDGVLQAVACNTRSQVTPQALTACTMLCPDNKFVPTDGRRYISKVDGVTNVPVSLATVDGKMVDLGPQKAFQCMALIGDSGCGMESPLESSKRALDGHRNENTGFLRSNSVLAVIFITDEDDCSAQLAKRYENNPSTRDCDPAQPDSYECYNVDYRCLARSIQCDESMLVKGAKSGCKERTNSYLENVDKYVTFFRTLRPASKLVVSGIWTLPSITDGGKVEISPYNMGTTSPSLNRTGGTGASCVYGGDQTVYGQAQLRLSKFAAGLGKSNVIERSICDIDNYDKALDAVADSIMSKLNANCLGSRPKVVTKDGKLQPLCLVGDVDESVPYSVSDTLFEPCSTGCCSAWAGSARPETSDPNIQTACRGEVTDSCYCAVRSLAGLCSDTAVAGVWRKGGAAPPPGKVVSFRCASAASP